MPTLSTSCSRVARAALLALVLAPVTAAQVSHGGVPAGLRGPLGRPAPLTVVDPPDTAAYLAEDAARGHRPLRYGALLDLSLDLSDGLWTDLPDGSRAWRTRIVSPGAKSLAVEFAALDLPSGARLYVYNEENETLLGAYTQAEVNLGGGFVFEPYPGDDITLEIDVAAGASDPALVTQTLVWDYRDVFGLMDGSVVLDGEQQSDWLGACLIDVNCPQGSLWEQQKRAVVRTLSAGALCSGALINNTNNDGTRYVLSANHCGQTSNCVFLFKYQRSGCGTGTAPTSMTVSGCTVLASTSSYDNRLLRINPTIPIAYEPFYAGWTRSTSGTTSYAFSMGHPSGGPKKISIDANGAIRESVYWRVHWSEGTLEGGSSGGPLYDQDGRVRGPACCVDQFSCNQSAWFGRFDRFWATNPIAQYLDPTGQNPTSIDGYDPICAAPSNVCGTSPNSVGSGAVMAWSGSTSYANNDLVLVMTGAPVNTSFIFFFGDNLTFMPLGNGFRCIGDPIVRLSPSTTDILGIGVLPFDNTLYAILPGDTRLFQGWYRDPAGGGSFFNLSDTLEVEFCAN